MSALENCNVAMVGKLVISVKSLLFRFPPPNKKISPIKFLMPRNPLILSRKPCFRKGNTLCLWKTSINFIVDSDSCIYKVFGLICGKMQDFGANGDFFSKFWLLSLLLTITYQRIILKKSVSGSRTLPYLLISCFKILFWSEISKNGL